MMKKLLFLGSAVLAFSLGTNAQSTKQGYLSTSVIGQEPVSYGNGALKTASTPTVVVDTLHYYLNKYYFKTGKTDLKTYPYTQTNATNVVNAVPPITFCGSRFDVPPGQSVVVTGLEGYAQRRQNSLNLSIPVRLYLCKLNAQNMPILPAIDSVSSLVGGLEVSNVGGNFQTIRTMTANFAVLFRNASATSADYVNLIRTNGAVEGNFQVDPADRSSDGNYGYVRHNGTFYSTRNFTLASGFGTGTDYEFMVAPRVTYTISAGHTLPQGVINYADTVTIPDTICARTNLVFTNTSSPFYEHRMYNLHQFFRKWDLYTPFVVRAPFTGDSSITWSFEFRQGDPRVYLPYVNNGTITISSDDGSRYPHSVSSPCFLNEFRARLKPMSAYGRQAQLVYNENFVTCLKYCDDDAVGLSTVSGTSKLNVFPNPAVNGKSLITGLEGKNTVVIYDMLGQIISNEVTNSSTMTIDLSKQPKGTYVVRILNSNNQNKMVKIVNQN